MQRKKIEPKPAFWQMEFNDDKVPQDCGSYFLSATSEEST